MPEYTISKTEAKKNKEAYKQIVQHLEDEKSVVWKYKVIEKGAKLNVIIEGSIGRKRKKVVLSGVPAFITKKQKKAPTAVPKTEKGQLKVGWVKDSEKGSLYFCQGEGVTKEDAMLLCAYFDKDRFDILSGVLNPCLIRQLEKRGFDLSTLSFSIKKKL